MGRTAWACSRRSRSATLSVACPPACELIGIEPEDLGWGEGLTLEVARSTERAARLVRDYLLATPPFPAVSERTTR